MTPEEKARVKIDQMFEDAGWKVIDRDFYSPTLTAAAIREGLLEGNREADYFLFVNGMAVGILEAKRKEVDVTSDMVCEQADLYARGVPECYKAYSRPLPIIYQSNGEETIFRDFRDEDGELIELNHIVKAQLHLDDEDVKHRNRMEMNGIFSWELGKGEHSRILFRKDGVELAELVYNPKNADTENDNVGMKDLVVPTVPQKPDIVLQLTKNDLQQGMKMTYLFDAKYRIDGKDKGVDVPPDGAINQMHRYRDAIYYKDYDANALKKEVIGGYILFPGDGEPNDVAVSKFYKTIKEVNIGAFPLRPKDVENRKLLENFIDELIHTKSYETIAHVIPQKGAYVEVGNRVLIGLVKEDNRLFQAFMDGTATLYYSGKQFPTTIALQDLHFFMPYIKGKGIRDVYEIVKVRTITGKEAKQTDEDDADSKALRLAFELRYVRKQYAEFQPIDTTKMIVHTFVDTTFDKLGECIVGK